MFNMFLVFLKQDKVLVSVSFTYIKSVLYIDMRYKMRDNCYLRLFERTITFVIQEGVPGKENATVLLYCLLSLACSIFVR